MKLSRYFSILLLSGALAACQDAPTGPSHSPDPVAANVQRGWTFDVDGTPIEVSYTVIDGRAIHEGDIDLGAAGTVPATRQALLQRASAQPGGPRQGATINGSSYRWANGVVPYVISGSFNAAQQQMILDAMAHISANVPGVTFQPRGSQSSYASFTPHASACNSPVGRQGGSQIINLGPGCFVLGIVVHEILHTLGMWHEQSRCDRDTYITVNSANVQSGQLHNFDKKCSGNTSVFAYDEGSIMHYAAYAFSGNGLPTITSKRGLGHLMGQTSGLAQTDISTVNYIYKPYGPPVVSVAPDANGNAVATWQVVPGASHYTFSHIERSEYYDNRAGGPPRISEGRYGPVTVYGNSYTDGTYSGTDLCVYEDYYGLETTRVSYEWEIQAHFPDGLTSSVRRSGAPIAPC